MVMNKKYNDDGDNDDFFMMKEVELPAATIKDPNEGLYNSTVFGPMKTPRTIEMATRIAALKHQMGIAECTYKEVCEVCDSYVKANEIPASVRLGRALGSSTFLSRNGRCLLANKKSVVDVLERHIKSALHVYVLGQNNALSIRTSLARALVSKNEQLIRLMRTALNTVANYRSLLSYEYDVRLQVLNGLDMGNRQHSREAMKNIILCIGDVWLEDMRNHAQSRHPLTGHKGYIGTMADKVTDAATKQWQMMMHTKAFRGRRVMFVTDLALVTQQADAVEGEQPIAAAGGRACFDKIVNSVDKRLGIDLHENKREAPALDGTYQNLQFRSFCFDGEKTYQGHLSGVLFYLHKEHGLGDPTIWVLWDPPHDQDLANAAMSKSILYIHVTVDGIVAAVYAHYARSPQKLRGLTQMSDEDGTKLQKLHFLFEVRFIESQLKAYRAMLIDLPVVVKHLREDLAVDERDGGPTPEKRAKMNTWVRQMGEMKFVMYLAVLMDVHTLSRTYSKRCQSDTNFILDLPTARYVQRVKFDDLCAVE